MLNPLMLLGMLGLSVPIIIHLIQRQKLTPQPLATLQFLDPEDVANSFAPQPRDLLQLLLRLLLLALFILLMSRLTIGGSEVGPRTIAVIMDQSMSMQRKHSESGSLFDADRATVLELIAGMRPEDRMKLYLVGDAVTTETGYLQDPAELKAIAEGFQVSDSGALALTATIREAFNQLRARREVNACVLVFTDMQRQNFEQALAEAAADPTSDAAELSAALDAGQVRLVFVNDAPATPQNVSIETASLTPTAVHLGAGGRLTAQVHNESDEARDVALTLREGTTDAEQRTIRLESGETIRVDLVHRFDSPIDTPVSVAIGEDDLPGDNRYVLPMRMKGRRQILLVTPPSNEDADTEMEVGFDGLKLLGYALNPGEALGQGTDTFVSVKKVSTNLLERVSLPLYSTIVCYGVSELSEQSQADLVTFVRNGGGLYLIADAEASPLRFNATFAGVLDGFAIGGTKNPETALPVDTNEMALRDPMMLPMLNDTWGDLTSVWVQQYTGVEADGKARPALRAGNGDWLMAAISLGRGKVVVQLFDNDLTSTSLPRTTIFLPMVQTVVRTIAPDPEDSRPDTLRIGESLRLATPEYRGLGGEVQLTGPDATYTLPLSGKESDSVRVEGVLRAGAYEVSHPAKRTGRSRWVTANPVAGEANLAPMTDDEQALLFGTEQTVRVAPSEVAAQFTTRHELVRPLLILVLLAFLVEAGFGAWQSRSGQRHKDQVATNAAAGTGDAQ